MKQECSKLISFLSDCQLSKKGRQRKQKTFKKLKKKDAGVKVSLCYYANSGTDRNISPALRPSEN